MKFRLATIEDADLLRAWRNDPATMAASLLSHEVSEAEHLEWLRNVLSDHVQALYIAEEGGEPIGTIRRKGWHMSWTVAPRWRKRGLGSAMVSAFTADRQGPFVAEIRSGNLASRSVAKKAGFVPVVSEDGIETWRRP